MEIIKPLKHRVVMSLNTIWCTVNGPYVVVVKFPFYYLVPHTISQCPLGPATPSLTQSQSQSPPSPTGISLAQAGVLICLVHSCVLNT